jgi:hypothetical protein
MANITDSEGYKKLLAAVVHDETDSPGFHNYGAKLAFAISRAEHYAAKTGLDAADILNAWEKQRDCWYVNYYQECNQPEIKGNNVRVFETVEELKNSIGKTGFRCPMCAGISKSPCECDSGKEMSRGEICNWKSYGLLGTLGKGVYVFVKSELRGQNIFMPIAYETVNNQI